ncbi:hypothetical protein H4R33_003473 [Dimargaris cristalligena]|uniref:Uncharacterized protein n=1 Tax=Dimargaris cristalligena TaxID=215637 RepID=A0A4P9ZXI0_9FUNG|nr:hypothetical protein H4R33_003473 [Dimargaris cristalligena]RKP37612.1 hypothetical protein BJ085DRAFT_32822 [Dimargaris cristalligena]|eukprot:RKP37612.1 hypothetical protein BJ085DRAFT_32822 [Dimargaris cristalligena]
MYALRFGLIFFVVLATIAFTNPTVAANLVGPLPTRSAVSITPSIPALSCSDRQSSPTTVQQLPYHNYRPPPVGRPFAATAPVLLQLPKGGGILGDRITITHGFNSPLVLVSHEAINPAILVVFLVAMTLLDLWHNR